MYLFNGINIFVNFINVRVNIRHDDNLYLEIVFQNWLTILERVKRFNTQTSLSKIKYSNSSKDCDASSVLP